MVKKLIATPWLILGVLVLGVLTACGTPPQPTPTTFTVTVDVTGAGTGTVTSAPEGINVTSGGEPGTLTVSSGTEVTLTANAATGSTFIGWSGACTGTDVCVVDVDADVSVTATFALSTGTLTVATDGDGTGNVVSDPAGIDLDAGDASATFSTGSEITLTASAADGSDFIGWDGACVGQGETCTFTFVEDAEITATFTLPLTLNVSVVSGTGSDGFITSDPVGIDTDSGDTSADFPVGTTVTLTATATMATGAFAGWVGGGCDDVLVPVCTVTMDAAKDVIGTFNEIQEQVVRVAAGTDDAVEFLGDSAAGQGFTPPQWLEGWIWGTRTNLHLGFAPYHNLTETAFRFPGLSVPAGAIVTSAIVQVTADSPEAPEFPTSGDLNLTIQGELSPNPSGFVQPALTATTFDITLRPRTDASVIWSITETWSSGQVHQAPDASSILQEIIGQDGWAAGNAVALFLKGGSLDEPTYRRVRTYESGDPVTRHPTLFVEYVVMPPLP